MRWRIGDEHAMSRNSPRMDDTAAGEKHRSWHDWELIFTTSCTPARIAIITAMLQHNHNNAIIHTHETKNLPDVCNPTNTR